MALGGFGEGARKVMEIKTGSGGDFLVLGMDGNEELGRLSEYRVQLVGELDMLDKPKKVDFDALIGTRATVSMKIDEDQPRYFNAYITRMQQSDQVGRFESFTATLKPWLWFATRTVNSKVFQKKSVKEIVTEVLDVYSTDYEWRLIIRLAVPEARLLHPVPGKRLRFRQPPARALRHLLLLRAHRLEAHDGADRRDGQAQEQADQGPDQLGQHDEVLVDGDQLARRPGSAVGEGGGARLRLPGAGHQDRGRGARPRQRPPRLGDSEVFEFTGKGVQNSVKEEAQAQPSADAAKQRAKVLIEELTALGGDGHRHDQRLRRLRRHDVQAREPSARRRERQLPRRLGELPSRVRGPRGDRRA